MKYQVVDSGFKLGREKNVMFATNDQQKAITVAKECGQGVLVIEKRDVDESETVIFVSDYRLNIGIDE